MFKKRHYKKVIFLTILLLLIASLLVFLIFYNPEPEKKPSSTSKVTANKEAASPKTFNQNMLYSLLKEIKAEELHNPPFSSNYPKIEIYVGDSVYNAKIIDNKITVEKGAIEEKDIIIYTNEREVIKMSSPAYIKDSFTKGLSKIELVASKSELFLKGYLTIYDEFSEA